MRGEFSPVPFRGKRRPFCGDIGGLLAIVCRFKETKDCLVDLVGIEPTTSSMPWNWRNCKLLTAMYLKVG